MFIKILLLSTETHNTILNINNMYKKQSFIGYFQTPKFQLVKIIYIYFFLLYIYIFFMYMFWLF